jgi:hypothetical protein
MPIPGDFFHAIRQLPDINMMGTPDMPDFLTIMDIPDIEEIDERIVHSIVQLMDRPCPGP